MELGLQGRVALVTGGSRGIGRATCLALAREGCKVAPLARTAADVQETCRAIAAVGAEGLPLVCDVTERPAVDAALGRLREAFGPPTVLVLAAAAHYRIQKLHTVDDATADHLLSVDVTGAVDLCRRTVADMMVAGYGRILVVGSVAARTGVAGGTLYATGKAALEGLVRGLSVDYARRGVTSNVVSVAFADTERLQQRVAGDAEARLRLESATATRRLPSAEDIADVITFLASPRASAITGAVVDATAGGHLNNLW